MNPEVFSPGGVGSEKPVAVEIAKRCAKATVVMIDVGHCFDIALRESRRLPMRRGCFVLLTYGNPESYVPGGYSETAFRTMREIHKIVLVNANLNGRTCLPGVRSSSLPCRSYFVIGFPKLGHSVNLTVSRI
ncbi:MAG: hypothetical protein OXF02_03705 [Simkaniaceae bacterium]|nr:hypothetical protein [Simkaniaceae bacterium]